MGIGTVCMCSTWCSFCGSQEDVLTVGIGTVCMCSTWCSFCGSHGDVLTVGDRDCLYVFYMVHLVFRIQLAKVNIRYVKFAYVQFSGYVKLFFQVQLCQIRLCPIFRLCQIKYRFAPFYFIYTLTTVVSNSFISNCVLLCRIII